MAILMGRNIWNHNKNLTLYSQRLASGLKINSASDNAANLSLSEKLKSNLRAADILKNNAQTGVNVLSTLDGDLDQMTQMLQRMRDLSVQGLNGVYSIDEKKIIMDEIDQLAYEIKRVNDSSTFSDRKLITDDTSDPLQILVNDSGQDNYIDLSEVSKKMLFVDVLAKDSDVYMLNMNPGDVNYVEFNNKLYKLTNTSGETRNLIYGYKEDLTNEDNSINFVQDFAGINSVFAGPYENDQVQMGNGERYLNLTAGQTSKVVVGSNVFSLTNSQADTQTAVFDTTGTNLNMISGADVSGGFEYALSAYNTAVGTESAIKLNGSEQKYINYAGRLYSITNNSASEETLVYRNAAGLQVLSGNVTSSLLGTISAPTALNATTQDTKLSASQTLYYTNAGNLYSLKNNTAQAQTVVLNAANSIINPNASVTRTALATTNGSIGMTNPYSIDAVAGQKYYVKSGDNSQLYELTASATGKLLVDFDGTNINGIGGVGASIVTKSVPDYENVTPDGSNQFVMDLGANSQESITIGGEVYNISNNGAPKNNRSFTYDPVGKTITEDVPNGQITVDGYQGDLASMAALGANDYYQSTLASGQSSYMVLGSDIFKITNSSGGSTDSVLNYDSGAHTLSSSAAGVTATLLSKASFTANTAADRSANIAAGSSSFVQFGNDNFEIRNNGANIQNVVFNYSAGNLTVDDPEIAASLTITKRVADNASQSVLAAGDIYTTLTAGGSKNIESATSKFFNLDNTSGARTAVFRLAGNTLTQRVGTGVNTTYDGDESFETLSTASDYYIEMAAAQKQYIKVGTSTYLLDNVTAATKTDVFRQVGANLATQNANITETNIPISNQSNFGQVLPIVDWSLNVLNMRRAQIGSKMAALSQTINMNDSHKISLAGAQSTLIDADIASEQANYAKTSILREFSVTLLGQTKNLHQGLVMTLLQ